MKKLHWLAIVILGLFLILVAFKYMFNEMDKDYNRRAEKCESRGGIFYEGGFGADNCVYVDKYDHCLRCGYRP